MKKICVLMVLALMLCGCATMFVNRRQAYVDAHPDLSEKTKQAILNGEVFVSMTKEEVIASWGDTNQKNQSISFLGTSEIWTYGGCSQYGCNMNMVTFAGDRVISLDSSRS